MKIDFERLKSRLPLIGKRNQADESEKKEGQSGRQRAKKRPKKKKWLKIVIVLAVLAAILITPDACARSAAAKEAAAQAQTVNIAVVTRRSITSQLSSSGTLEAAETYSITSLVEGEIISANFEEGDQVEKDQVLYEIDHSSMESELTSATNRLDPRPGGSGGRPGGLQ